MGVLASLDGMTPGVDGGNAPGIDSNAGVSARGRACCAKAGFGSSILPGGKVIARFGIASSGAGGSCVNSSGPLTGAVRLEIGCGAFENSVSLVGTPS